jgi:hypothetical protein
MERVKEGSMGVANLYDIHDKDGDLMRIEVVDSKGEFVFDIVWDERESQTKQNRDNFRKWSKEVVRRYGYIVTD